MFGVIGFVSEVTLWGPAFLGMADTLAQPQEAVN